MQKKPKLILNILASAALTIVLYVLLHEFGHVIVMLSAGATVTEFSVLGAHVSAVGGSYTNLSDLWLHANGALFPLVVAWVYLLFYKNGVENTFYRIFSWFFGLVPAASLLAWVVIPFSYLNGNAPAGDDVTNFLFNFSQEHSPLLVSAAAALLIGIDVVLLIKKRVPQNFIETVRDGR